MDKPNNMFGITVFFLAAALFSGGHGNVGTPNKTTSTPNGNNNMHVFAHHNRKQFNE